MNKREKRLLHFALTIIIVVLGAVGLSALTASKPPLKKRKITVSIPVVRAIRVKTGPQSVLIRGEGTVRPLQEITLIPQVGGKVVYVSPALVNGGEFRKGHTLLGVDPVDYKLALNFARAKVKDSESRLKITEEEAAAAQEEWHLHRAGGSKTTGKPPPLVAKEPQLAAAQAKLEADRAELRKVLLDLERTKLKAPFDGRVSQENVDIGQYVSPGQALATLYSTDAAEIVLPLEDEDLYWFYVPGFTPGKGRGSPAVVRARIAGREMIWSGEVVRAEGKLDEHTRMVNVVIRVKKPYAKKPPLAMGLFVSVDIKGRTLPTAAIIPRSALHQGNVVWLVEKGGRLHFRKVEVARIQGENVLVRTGLKDGDVVAISSLKAVSDGMDVRNVLVKEVNR
ncbi:MAG: efflux RND transporter periplasmic adaptor subunit [Deltaproteobacteria bacterium]|nr:efflux RND transporter periplasmic adaptor subunit [Deltaproteobacteria bacterium]